MLPRRSEGKTTNGARDRAGLLCPDLGQWAALLFRAAMVAQPYSRLVRAGDYKATDRLTRNVIVPLPHLYLSCNPRRRRPCTRRRRRR
jgi:hypothetical protein